MERDSNVVQAAEAVASATSKTRESGRLGEEHEVEAHVRQLLETLPGMIRIASSGGQLEYADHELPEIVGVPFAEIAGTKWSSQSTAGLPFRYCLIALNSYLTSLLSRRGFDNPSRQPVRRVGQRPNERLSARECAVLALIAKGQSNKRVAQTLKIAPETVKSHVKRTFMKLGAKTRAEAVARATELGFLWSSVDRMPSLTAMKSSRELRETSLVGAV
jgi:DNA-binding CsgD family transcriptional regulator